MFPQLFVAWNTRHIDMHMQVQTKMYTDTFWHTHIYVFICIYTFFLLVYIYYIDTHIYLYIYTNICISTYSNHRFATQNGHIYVTKSLNAAPAIISQRYPAKSAWNVALTRKIARHPSQAITDSLRLPRKTQMQSLNRKMHDNTSTTSRIHCSCHRKNHIPKNVRWTKMLRLPT